MARRAARISWPSCWPRTTKTIDEKLWQPIARGMTFLSGDFEKDDTYHEARATAG